jgi:3-hydroxy-9,10-secoandrosta-1,3,5(10)-triene-9,17-dione monooxygenase
MWDVREEFRGDRFMAAQPIAPLDYLARARGLSSLVAAHAAAGDRDRRLPTPMIEALKQAALFRMLQPARYGGGECDPTTFLSVQAALSEVDMSTGWLHGVMGVLAFHLALFSQAAQDEVWLDDPDALLASSYMPTGKAFPIPGGFQLSGRWGFASGADHADWFLLGGVAADESGQPRPMVFLVPRADVQVHDTWCTTGLRGTGSQDLSVAGRVVPEYRTHGLRDRFLGLSPGLSVNRAAIYRVPLPQLLFRVISSPAIGGLRGMLEAYLTHNGDRVTVTGAAAVTQLACAEAAAELHEMTTMMAANFDRLLDHAQAGSEAPIPDRMIYRLQASLVTERCCRLGARLFKATGASGLSTAKPFGRFLADIQAARQHAANQYEAHGRALGAAMLGQETEDTLL